MTYDDDNRSMTVNGSSVMNDDNGNLTWSLLTNGSFVAQTYDGRNRLVSSGGVTIFMMRQIIGLRKVMELIRLSMLPILTQNCLKF